MLTAVQRLAMANMKTLAGHNIRTIEQLRAQGKCARWADVAAIIKSPVPERFAAKPDALISPLGFINFRAWYRDGVEDRFIEALKSSALAAHATPTAVHVKVDGGEFKLRPQQNKAVDQIVSVFSDPEGSRAIVLPLGTGRGKTIIIGAVCKALKSEGLVRKSAFMPPILYLTKNRVVRPTIRKLGRMGLTEKDVLVLSYSALRTKRYRAFFSEHTEIRRSM